MEDLVSDNEMVLPGRETIEAYISQSGFICLKQENPLGEEPNVVLMLLQDIPHVVAWLNALAEEVKHREE